jgi:type II secretory pathway pseudopilin PulG
VTRAERGETLLELVIAVAVMGVAVVAIVGGMGTAVMMSDIHRKQATAGATARDYAETAQAWVAGGHYDAGTAPDYRPATVGYVAPSGYSAAQVSVTCWNGSAWTGCAQAQQGLEQLAVQVSSVDGRASEQVVVVLRKPCGTAQCA